MNIQIRLQQTIKNKSDSRTAHFKAEAKCEQNKTAPCDLIFSSFQVVPELKTQNGRKKTNKKNNITKHKMINQQHPLSGQGHNSRGLRTAEKINYELINSKLPDVTRSPSTRTNADFWRSRRTGKGCQENSNCNCKLFP